MRNLIDFRLGDAASVLKTLPAESVHCCVTSPPYYGLRDYGHEEQIGLEGTVEGYVARLVEVFSEVRRVLRADGTLWLNLGDSYAGSWGNYHPHSPTGAAQSASSWPRQTAHDFLPPTAHLKHLRKKNLLGIPWRVALALQADGWYLRTEIIWEKSNCLPESVKDRPTRSHEYLFLLSKSERYFYDMDATREPHKPASLERAKSKTPGGPRHPGHPAGGHMRGMRPEHRCHPLGRNKRTIWTVAITAFRGAHFATYPPALIEPCVLAGTSARGCCPECGTPHLLAGAHRQRGHLMLLASGWQPGCQCDADEPVPCTVLDPFLGAGTTALVAVREGRRCVGIELNPEYLALARERLAPHVEQAA